MAACPVILRDAPCLRGMITKALPHPSFAVIILKPGGRWSAREQRISDRAQ